MKKFKFTTGTFTYLIIALLLAAATTFSPLDFAALFRKTINIDDGKLHVFYIDVGQGDSTFIKLPNGETMLIDAGEKEYGKKVFDTLRLYKTKKINYLVATHPHTDHIGGMQYILENFETDHIYMTNATANAKTFEALLDTIKEQGKTISMAKVGTNILSDENLSAVFVAPVNNKYDDLNNYSAVIKLTYADTSFVFAGDAEKEAEDLIRENIKCDVLKIGHHGSSSSTSKNFLKKTEPKYAVISCGVDNDYEHPHKEVVSRLEKANVNIYRTDLQGTIEAVSDGTVITFNTQY